MTARTGHVAVPAAGSSGPGRGVVVERDVRHRWSRVPGLVRIDVEVRYRFLADPCRDGLIRFVKRVPRRRFDERRAVAAATASGQQPTVSA
jgi:hypothetical protein